MNILFVCTQNVFRSFSAHLIMEKLIFNNSLNSVKMINIDSCGTIANSYEHPYSWTKYKLMELGISKDKIIQHKNKKITQNLVDWSDVIIPMTKEHKKFILNNFKVSEPKIRLFNYFVTGVETDLMDDNETNEINSNLSLEEFVVKTVKYIYDNMDKVYATLESDFI